MPRIADDLRRDGDGEGWLLSAETGVPCCSAGLRFFFFFFFAEEAPS